MTTWRLPNESLVFAQKTFCCSTVKGNDLTSTLCLSIYILRKSLVCSGRMISTKSQCSLAQPKYSDFKHCFKRTPDFMEMTEESNSSAYQKGVYLSTQTSQEFLHKSKSTCHVSGLEIFILCLIGLTDGDQWPSSGFLLVYTYTILTQGLTIPFLFIIQLSHSHLRYHTYPSTLTAMANNQGSTARSRI